MPSSASLKRHPWIQWTVALGLLCCFALDPWTDVTTFSKTPVKTRKCWQVSNFGRCRNMYGTITYGSLKRSAYHKVQIEGQEYFVHRLVKFAFDGPPGNDLAWQVNHVDGNKSNNRLDNLNYATCSHNVCHSYCEASRRFGGHKFRKQVMFRPKGSTTWTTSKSIGLAAAKLNLSPKLVSECCRCGSFCKGFEFRFSQRNGEMDGEEWRPMVDPKSGRILSGRMVSSLGRIKFEHGRISKGYRQAQGYFVTKTVGMRHCECVHRLVVRAFLGPPPSPKHTQINHKDGDRGNNSVANLEYVTPSENMLHHYSHGKSASRNDRKAVESRRYGSNDTWTSYPSMSIAAKKKRLHRGCISNCVNGRQKQTGGYEFRLSVPTPEQLPGEVWRNVDLVPHSKDRAQRNRAFRKSPKVPELALRTWFHTWKVAKPLKDCPRETGFGKFIKVGQRYCNFDQVMLVNHIPSASPLIGAKLCHRSALVQHQRVVLSQGVRDFKLIQLSVHAPWKLHGSINMMHNEIIQLCQDGNHET